MPTLVNEVVEVLVQYFDEQFAMGIILVSTNLYEQTFLQGTRANARRIELLQDLENSLQFCDIRVKSLIYLCFVGKDGEGFLEESVFVELTDEVFHEFFLVVREFEVRHLFAEAVSQGECVIVGHELGSIVAVADTTKKVGYVFFAAIVIGSVILF